MPLLSDAKKCYVGNTPITRIMSGTGFQVWPKAPLTPSGPFDNLQLFLNRGDGIDPPYIGAEADYFAMFLYWEVNPRPSTCVRASAYTIQYLINGAVGGWKDFSYFGNPNTLNWMPSAYPTVMVSEAWTTDPLSANYSFRVKYDGPSGVEYSPYIQWYAALPTVPTQYQQNECNNRP